MGTLVALLCPRHYAAPAARARLTDAQPLTLCNTLSGKRVLSPFIGNFSCMSAQMATKRYKHIIIMTLATFSSYLFDRTTACYSKQVFQKHGWTRQADRALQLPCKKSKKCVAV